LSRKLKVQTLLRATVHMVGAPDSVPAALAAALVSRVAAPTQRVIEELRGPRHSCAKPATGARRDR